MAQKKTACFLVFCVALVSAVFATQQVFAAVPEAIDDLVVSGIGYDQITLGWTTPADGDSTIARYEIQQNSGTWTPISGSDAATVSHTVTGLTLGTGDTFKVRAVNGDGNAPESNTVTVMPNKFADTIPDGLSLNDRDYFGSSTALSSDGATLAVGAWGDDTDGSDKGAVHLFTKTGTTWTHSVKIDSDFNGFTLADGDYFGSSTALSSDGTTLAVGALHDNTGGSDRGAVHLFTKSNNTWTYSVKIDNDFTGFTLADGDWFGYSTALSSDGATLAVGAQGDDTGGTNTNRGAVYIFTKNENIWTYSVKIDSNFIGLTLADNDSFGSSAALSSDGAILAVGAPHDDTGGTDTNRGAVHLFTKSNDTWTHSVKIDSNFTGFTLADDDFFGTSTALSSDGTTLAVGAYGENTGGDNRGAVFTFTKTGTTWTHNTKIAHGSNGLTLADDDWFGSSAALSANGTLVVGAGNDDTGGDGRGAAYLLNLPDTVAPYIATQIFTNDNQTNDRYPKNGDNLTFSFTFSETLSTAPTVTIGGASATFIKDGDTYTATYQVTAGTDEGPIVYDINTLTDSAGQSFDPPETNSPFIVDRIAPTLAEIADGTSGGDSHIGTTADRTPDFSFTSDEAGTIAYAGDCTSSETIAVSGTNTVSFNALTPATYTDCAVTVTDGAGNSSSSLAVPDFTVQQIPEAIDDLVVSGIGYDQITLGWTTPDNEGPAITEYEVQQDATGTWDAISGSDNATVSHTVTGLTPGTSYTFKVRAVNSDGDAPESNTVTVIPNKFVNDIPDGLTLTDGDSFGISAALSSDGTTLAVGAERDDTGGSDKGAVHLFTKTGTTWTHSVTIDNNFAELTLAEYDYFGSSAALSSDGTILAVGARGDDTGGTDTNKGAVHLFTKNDDTWTYSTKIAHGLNGFTLANDDQFGISAALSSDGTTLAVGARGDDTGGANTNKGAVHIFTKNGNSWTHSVKIDSSFTGLTLANDDQFGISAALSSNGTTLAVGAWYDDTGGANTNRGAVHLFTKSNNTWTHSVKIDNDFTGLTLANGDSFGISAALSSDGTTLAVGAYGDNTGGTDRGAVHLFTTHGTQWTYHSIIANGSNGLTLADNDYFGISAALSSDGTLVVGAHGSYQGAAYLFNLPDTVAPYITTQTFTNSTPANGNDPKTGDDLTFSFTFSETLSTAPTVTIEGASATFTKNDNTYTATYQVTDATAEGPIAYDIDTLTDSAGQSFDPPETNSPFTVDRTAPTLNAIADGASGGDSYIGTTADTTPDFSFTSDEAGTIAYAGDCTSSETTAVSGTNTVSFNALASTTYTDCAITVTDGAGNSSSSLAVPDFTVQIQQAPEAVSDLTATATPNTVTLSWVTPGDGGATITNYQMKQGTGTYTDIAGSDDETTTHTVTGLTEQTAYTFRIRAVNNVGAGEEAAAVTITTTDGSAPYLTETPTLATSNTNSAYAKEGDTLTLTFTVSEALQSIPSVTIMGQTVTPTAEENTYTADYTVTAGTPEEAVTYDIGILRDTAGNTADPPEETDNAITIDTTAPSITVGAIIPAGAAQEKTVRATVTDTNKKSDGYRYAITAGSTCDNSIIADNNAAQAYTEGEDILLNQETYNTQVVCFRAEDEAGNSNYQVATEITGIDTTAPVITLTGASPLTLEVGDTYTDPGATATEGVTVTTEGTVDTNTPGTYTITYTATDEAGNEATKERTVTVTPTVPQAVSDLTATATPNTVTLSWVTPGDGGATITNYQMKQGTGTYTDIAGSDDETTTHTVTGLTEQTAYTFRIRAVNNVGAGEEAAAVTITTTDGSAPYLTETPTLATSNTNSAYAKEGDTLTLTFTVSEALQSIPSVTIMGQTVTPTAEENTYTADYTVTAGTPEEAVTYDIGILRDTAGNTADPPEETDNAITIDTTAPSITVGAIIPAGAAQEKTVRATVTDTNKKSDGYRYAITAGSTCDNSIIADNNAAQAYTEGEDILLNQETYNTQVVCFRAEDEAGNSNYQVATEITGIDTTAPVISLTGASPLTLEVGDTYTDPGATATEGVTVTTEGTVDTNTPGTYTITYTATDEAGNEATKERTVTVTPTVPQAVSDLTATATPNTVTLSWVTPGDGGATITNYQMKQGTGTYTDIAGSDDETTTHTVTGLTEQTAYTFRIRAVNNVGAGEEAAAVTITTTDGSAPYLTETPTLATSNTNSAYAKEGDTLTLTFTVSEALQSIPSVTIMGQTVTPTAEENTYTADYTVTAGTPEEAVTYDIGILRDTAGNTADPPEETDNAITIDTTAPSITVGAIIPAGAAQEKTVRATVTDTNKKSDGYRYAITAGSTCNNSIIADNNAAQAYTEGEDILLNQETYNTQVVCFRAEDEAGNSNYQVATEITGIDTTAPVITLTGASPLTLEVGDTYTDPGATATEGAEVTATGNVDTNTPGTYTITYTATDEAGNEATKERTVTVTPTVPQAVSDLTATATPNTVTLSWVTPGDGGATITNYQMKQGTGTYTDIAGSDDETTTHTVTGLTEQTAYTFSIRAVNNVGAGEEAAAVTITTTDGSAPYLTETPTLATSNTNSAYAKEGDTLTLTFTVSEALQSIPSVTIMGQTVTPTAEENTYTADYTVTAGTPEEAVTYDIGILRDTAGNTADPPEETDNAITIDTTAPSITVGAIIPAGAAQEKTVRATVTDTNKKSDGYRYAITAGSTCDNSIIADNNAAQAYTEGEDILLNQETYNTQVVCFRAEDEAGNSNYQVATEITGIDTTAPVISLTGASPLTLEVGDTYTDPGATATEGAEVTATGNVDTNTPGTYTITYTATDEAGNEATKERTVTVTPTVPQAVSDLTATATPNTVTLSWVTPGDGGATITNYQMKQGTGTYTDIAGSDDETTTHTVTGLTEQTAYTFSIRAVNNVGAGEEAAAVTITTTDGSAPYLTETPTLATSNTNSAYAKEGDTLTLTFTVSEALQSIPSVTIMGQTVTPTAEENTYTADYTVTAGTPEEAVTYDIGILRDTAGNTADPPEETDNAITIDTTAPSITVGAIIPAGAAQEKTVRATVTDTNKKSDGYRYAITAGSTCDNSIIADNNAAQAYTEGEDILLNQETYNTQVVCFRAEDEAGNSNYQVATEITGIDTTAPVITLTGASPLTLEVGDTYTDPGATATEGAEVTATGNVDTNTPGTYTITYTATDEAGNEATKERTVTVTPTVPQAVSDLTATATPNTVTLSWVTPGDGGATITNYQMKQGTGTYTDIAGSDDETTTHTVTGLTEQTAYTFRIRAVNNVGAGEEAAAVTITTTDGSAPYLTETPTLATSNTNSAYAKEGDTLTLTFTVSEALQSIPSVTIMGQTVTPTAEENTYTADYTVTAGTPEEAVTYDIGEISDGTNTVNPDSVTSTVTVDTTPPIITLNGDNPRTLTVGDTYTDRGAAATEGATVTAAGTVNTETAGDYTITYTATDEAGNTGTATRTVRVQASLDTTAPVDSKETTNRKSSRGRRGSGGVGEAYIWSIIHTTSAPKVGAQQQQVTVTVPTIPTLISTPQTITGAYQKGNISENIRSIQKLLNQTNCPVAKTGVGSKGQETAYFGVLMKTAVQCYQTEKKLEITGAVTPELYALLIEDYTATLKAFVVYLTQLVSDIIAKKTAVVQ